MTNYRELQNGSDIRGIALHIAGGKDVNLDMESVTRIGAAFAQYTSEKLNKPVSSLRVAIGRDSRLSGEQLTQWLACGIASMGATACDGGMASTPAMFMCCVNELKFDAGIMVTASHLPMERNGMKFFTAGGGFEKEDISSILSLAESYGYAFTDACDPGTIGAHGFVFQSVDVMTPYIEGLKRKILSELNCDEGDMPFSCLHIVVDAGNGAGGFFAERLLSPLGADISGSQFLEPDGRFPNHQPNPENAAAMASICDAVRKSRADLGVIFDTDVDRAGAVLPYDVNSVLPSAGDAVALDRNRLIALMSAILHGQYGAITVVTDSITSTGLSKFIESLGCRHHRFKRGYRNVINEAKRLLADGENAILAMETSGHGALQENYFLDDGAYMIVKLLIELVRARRKGHTLLSLISSLEEPVESAEARLPVSSADFAEYTMSVLKQVEEYFSNKEGFHVVTPNYEGVRVNADTAHGNGWFLIRQSLHDPIMPCNLESNSKGGLATLARALLDCMDAFDGLDTESLRKLLYTSEQVGTAMTNMV